MEDHHGHVRLRLAAIILLLFMFVFTNNATAASGLSVSDCTKCHKTQSNDIDTAGAAHDKKINCIDCHASHRPISENNIPLCSQCHEGKAHYSLEDCLRCHDPHRPLDVVLEGELKAECLTCHTKQNEQLTANPSMHSEEACNFCHAEKHRVIPPCTECHEAHSEDMTQNDCSVCHAAHQPTVLEYLETTPNLLCASCHEDAYTQLQASETKHHDVACVKCHANKHKTVPQCSDCHGLPHTPGIHAKFTACGECHSTAHDLDHFEDSSPTQ